MGTAEPAVGRPELELRQLGVALHGVERREQRRGVDPVANGVFDGGHDFSSAWVIRLWARLEPGRAPTADLATDEVRPAGPVAHPCSSPNWAIRAQHGWQGGTPGARTARPAKGTQPAH